MLLIVATLLAGLGIFFFGFQFLTEHLKLLSSRRIREKIAQLAKNPLKGMFLGGLLSLTQSTSATMFILVGMARSGMITVRQTLPIMIGTNMLIGFIVFALVLDITLVVLIQPGIGRNHLYERKSESL